MSVCVCVCACVCVCMCMCMCMCVCVCACVCVCKVVDACRRLLRLLARLLSYSLMRRVVWMKPPSGVSGAVHVSDVVAFSGSYPRCSCLVFAAARDVCPAETYLVDLSYPVSPVLGFVCVHMLIVGVNL